MKVAIYCIYSITRLSTTSSFPLFFLSSPEMPENEATFAITAGGVADAKE